MTGDETQNIEEIFSDIRDLLKKEDVSWSFSLDMRGVDIHADMACSLSAYGGVPNHYRVVENRFGGKESLEEVLSRLVKRAKSETNEEE